MPPPIVNRRKDFDFLCNTRQAVAMAGEEQLVFSMPGAML
jgi:hypothetical protein